MRVLASRISKYLCSILHIKQIIIIYKQNIACIIHIALLKLPEFLKRAPLRNNSASPLHCGGTG